jgi:hypothetical protein
MAAVRRAVTDSIDIPDVSYARSGDVAIAYQVVGDGPVDLVFVTFFGNIRSSPDSSSASRPSRA